MAKISTNNQHWYYACKLCLCVCAESGLFAVPLATLLDQDQRRAPGTKVPFILQRVSMSGGQIVSLSHGQFNSSETAAIYQCILLYFLYGSHSLHYTQYNLNLKHMGLVPYWNHYYQCIQLKLSSFHFLLVVFYLNAMPLLSLAHQSYRGGRIRHRGLATDPWSGH